jgi:Family of unknown function (DUF5999)
MSTTPRVTGHRRAGHRPPPAERDTAHTQPCPHMPPCPGPGGPDREAARTLVSHPEQGWSLLCNGVVTFDDTGELLPGGTAIPPHRPTDLFPVTVSGRQ